MSRSRPQSELLRLAEKRFGRLSDAERETLEASEAGSDTPSEEGREPPPESPDEWPPGREARAEVLHWLSSSPDARPYLHPAGIFVVEARIAGDLRFTGAEIERRFALMSCAVDGDVILTDARVRTFALVATHCKRLFGPRLRAEGGVLLTRGFTAREGVVLTYARVDGALVGDRSTFLGGEVAFDAEGVEVRGNVLLRDVRAEGVVRLYGASVSGAVDCTDSTFRNRGGTALDLRAATVGRGIFLQREFRATGQVALDGASTEGTLSFQGGSFSNPEATAISADGLETKGPVLIRYGFRARGVVRFLGATIASDFDAHNGTFIVRDRGDHEDDADERHALVLDSAVIGGSLFMRKGFRGAGGVKFSSARIGRVLDCQGGSFLATRALSLSADGAEIAGSAWLNDGFCSSGVVGLTHSSIGGALNCNGATFLPGPEGIGGLNLYGTKVATELNWSNVTLGDGVGLTLFNAGVDHLEDDEASWPRVWPNRGWLDLAGFTYRSLADLPTWDNRRRGRVRRRLDWLRLQGGFSAQPYEQLIKVLRQSGHEAEARTVAIAKQDDRRKYGGLGPASRAANLILKWAVGYGYRPWLALLWGVALVAFGAMVFAGAHTNGLLVPLEEPHAPFSAFGYSLDTFLPIVNLGQEDAWTQSEDARALQVYTWGHIAIGWVLTTLGVLGVTGLVRRD